MMTSLADRKDATRPLLITESRIETPSALHTHCVRKAIYGRTSPRPDLCAFDAYGMDIVEGRA